MSADHRMIRASGSTAPAVTWCGRYCPASTCKWRISVSTLSRRRKTSAKWIVRYDIPDDSGILIEESLRPGHFDIFATFDQLHPYLATDFKEEVVKEG
jgi:hypothetical protein